MLNDNDSQPYRNLDVILTHCWLHNIVSMGYTGYPGIGLQWQMRKDNGSGSVVLKRSKFSSLSNLTGQEAAIRSTTGCKASVTIDSCNINNNFGGGIRWQGLVADPMQVKNTTIKGNYTKKSGGGIMAKSPLVLTACKILNNTAYEHGGGINYMCYDEPGMSVAEAGKIYPKNLELTMDAATIIDGNKTETGNGGGIMVWGRLINLTRTGQMGYVYHEYDQYGNVVGPYKLKVNLNGATIQNNTANGNGGGIYIFRENDASCYLLNCQLSYGNIKGNKALNGNGGGVCISQTGTPNPAHVSADHPAQDIEFYTGGNSTNMTISDNDAHLDGGGIYLYSVNSGAGWNSYQIFNTKVELNDKTLVENNKATNGDGGGIYLKEGTINLEKATIGGNDATLGNKALTGNGGGIYVNSGSVKMLSSTIKYNVANSSGGGVYTHSGDVLINHLEAGTDHPSNISYNTANLHGGGIYNHSGRVIAYGSKDGDIDYPIQITHNTATTGSGGGIFCMGNSGGSEYDIRLRRINISNNVATSGSGVTGSIDYGCGGGIYLQQGKISVINGTIDSNTANVGGGGVYTRVGDIDINPTKDERHASKITNNTAKLNGGGLNTHSGHIRIYGNSNSQRILITGNQATTGSGGALFCYGNDINEEYFTVRHADLVGNKALNGGGSQAVLTDVVSGCGGGLYLQQGKIHVTDVKIQNNYAKVNGGGINNHSGNIDVDGCLIGGTDYYNEGVNYDPAHPENTNKGNKADQSGGGIYTHAGDIDIEDYVETVGSINRYESMITYNKAVENGGGINTHQGAITINGKEMDDQIEISFNKANKGGGMYANAGTINAYNALIRDNTATQNGGGINNHSGNIALYGGILSNNTAELGHGGGAYTNVGDIDLFQFPSSKLIDVTLEDGTKVYNNIALKNGGAFNNHTGRVDIRHATLYNNTSTQGNGGAIFCEGPHANVNRGLGYTIRLLCSDMVQNKTRGQDGTEADPTGRGGGVYLKYGSIYAHYSNILNNEANIAGGGLDNHSGNILLYGCDIIGNRAIEFDGGGIFTKQGHITTGPSTRRDGSTGSKATVIQKNTAHYDGGGIYNEHGDLNLNGDLIGGTTPDWGNTAEKGDGGGVYIANGTINMKGGKIAYNTANSGKGGGVYSGGGQFNIEKRDDNPEPITLIVDVEVKRDGGGQNATVHYHLVDQGKYTSDVSNVKHGIVWWDKDTPGTKYKVIYDVTDSINYTYSQGEPACQRITIPSITADKTYKVKSFFEYEYSSSTYTGYSDEMEFITYSATLPTVVSGSVSNITKNSASGSGKIMDNGGSPITFKGVQIWKEDQTPDVSSTYLKPSTDETDYFSVNLTGLDPNALYHARAYATNVVSPSLETDYTFGATVDFTTLKNTPDMGSGPLTVTTDINSVGQIVVTASYTMPSGTTFGTGSGEVQGYGFVWSTDDDPELYADHTIAGVLSSGTTTFTAQYVGAREGIAAYVRAYATYEESAVTSTSDPTNYSITKPKQFFTPYLNGDPVVRAIDISNITQTSATITCKIYSGYNSSTTTYGVHLENGSGSYHSSDNYSDTDSTYTVNLTSLTVNTTYYLKAYATNDGGTTYSYGNGYNFTTLPVSKPQVLVQNVNVTINPSDYGEVKVTCLVESDGGEALDATGNSYGIIYDTIVGTSTTQHASSGLSSSGEYTYTITGLKPHGNYWVKAYATNSAGTHISQPIPFTTNYDKPSVVMTSVTNTATPDGSVTNATANFTVAAHSTNASDKVKTYGVCWSILHNPTRSESVVSDTDYEETTDAPVSVTDPQSKSKGMKQRFPNTKYFVRAYASTNTPSVTGDTLADIVYTAETHFITMPALLTGAATEITNNTAVLGGTINSRDSEGHLINGYYGVCWGTGANPERTAITPYNPSTPNNFTEVKITNANANIRPFSLIADSLTPGATYHYRAYYKSPAGEIAYGPDAASTFATYNFSLTVVCDPAAGGTVDKTYVGLNNGDNCSVTATPNPGYSFTNWTVSGTDASVSNTSTATTTFTMGTENATLTAHFTAINYTVSLTANPAAGGSVTGGGSSFTYNDEVTITATPADGYHFVKWTDDDNSGAVVSTNEEYTFNVTGNVNYTANFAANTKSRSSASRPRDIYPAPAREPWDWDDDFALAMTDTLPSAIDSLIQLREQLNRDVVVEPVDIPLIQSNKATRGGGIYMAKKASPSSPVAKLVFTGGADASHQGKIIFNYASEAGGGIYIADSGYMQMKYHCEVNANRVPAGKRGAGIYLNGRLYIGNASGDAAGTHGLIVNRNFAMDGFSESGYTGNPTSYATTNKDSLNNVFLTRYESDFVNNWGNDNNPGQNSYKYDDLATVITLLSDISGKDGSSKPYTNVGFSVLRGFCPVVATSKSLWGPYTNTASNSYTPPFDPPTDTIYEKWLYKLMKNDSKAGGSGFDENGALFEDSETYVAIHTRTKSQPFLPKYIYLWGCWTYPAVKEDPENLKPMAGSSSQSNPASDSDWQGHYVITDPENDGILHWDIYSEEGLSWFSSYVNGLNVFKTGDTNHDVYDAAKNPYATATLMNDIDLGSHIWIPIGSVTTFRDENIGGSAALFTDDPTHPHHFKGEFDGQGHTITGMNVRYVSGIYKYGLFGYLDKGAKVKNVFIDNSEFITDDGLMDYSVGGIAGLVTPSEGNSITISASEARVSIDVTNSQKNGTYVGGLVGKTAGSSGNVVTIHSSMAMPEITGAADYMGGLVGQLAAFDSLFNSFSNPKFPENNYDMNTNMYIGGLVGDNKGTVMNCYSRLQNVKGTTADSQDDEPVKSSASVFGWFAGTNSGTIKYCYAPKAPIAAGSAYKRYGSNNPDYHGTYDTTKLVSDKYGFKHRDQQMTAVAPNDAIYISNALNDTLIVGGLTNSLNAWVLAKGSTTYHPWMRTMASTINDDLPIPEFKVWTSTSKAIVEDELYNAVGSKDGVYMDYNLNANTLLGEYVTTDPSTYSSPSVYLYDPNTLADGTTAEPIRVTNIGTTNPNVTFEIHEDVGITVADGASSVGLKARVGVTFDNSNRSTLPELGGQPYDWHMFGSAIQGVPMGLRYHTDAEATSDGYYVWANYSTYLANGIPNSIYNGSTNSYDRDKMDPPMTQWYQSNNPGATLTYAPDKVGYFPTDTPYGTWRTSQSAADVGGSFDLYCYGEEKFQHWINFKRRGDASFYDHWRQDEDHGKHLNIDYTNENNLKNGKGYLMAVSTRSMLMADGTLNNGNVTYNATYTVNPMATVYDEMVRGTNLIGNPYQSYLDMDRFFTENSGVGNIYYIMDADKSTSTGRDYISYTKGSSYNPTNDAPPFLHPHQGFFVKVGGPDTITPITFNSTTMRVAGKYGTTGDLQYSNFRDRINYPLVNLLCYDSNNKGDLTTVEINRPEVGGGQKMKGLRSGKAILYSRFEDGDYQTLFAPEGVSEVPVRFEANEDDVFTMKWSMYNGDFNYVHLIDNLAGADVDMLTAQEYKFEGRTTDYISRFKLVFKVTDVDEYKDDDPGSKTFAFQMGDELIVNGAGILQMFDVTGRCLLSTQTAGAQSSVSLPKVAAGVYMLRLTGNQQNKVQKIIIK